MYSKFIIGLLCLGSTLAAPEMVRNLHNKINTTMNALKNYGHIYYNPMTGEPLVGEIEEDGRFPSLPKIGFRGLPCACIDESCGCCAGLNISSIKFDRRYCVNFTYDSSELTIDMKVLMNNDEIYQNSLSARNPPPICVPLPYIPILDFCLRFYDLSVADRNLKTCIDFETRVAHSPLLIMHFNCVRIGSNGISWNKPGDDEQPVIPQATTLASEEPIIDEVFDEVYFEVTNTTTTDDKLVINGTTLSPEDEDKIGEHRDTGNEYTTISDEFVINETLSPEDED